MPRAPGRKTRIEAGEARDVGSESYGVARPGIRQKRGDEPCGGGFRPGMG
jgi:hypothetical protein